MATPQYLTFRFDVTGFSQSQIDALAGQVTCQGEPDDKHPRADVTLDVAITLVEELWTGDHKRGDQYWRLARYMNPERVALESISVGSRERGLSWTYACDVEIGAGFETRLSSIVSDYLNNPGTLKLYDSRCERVRALQQRAETARP